MKVAGNSGQSAATRANQGPQRKPSSARGEALKGVADKIKQKVLEQMSESASEKKEDVAKAPPRSAQQQVTLQQEAAKVNKPAANRAVRAFQRGSRH